MTSIDTLLAVFLLVGVLGSLAPSLPGTAIILIGIVIHALSTAFDPIQGTHLLGYFFLFLIGWLGQYAVAALGTRRFGSTRYGVIGACVGMAVGLFIPIPGGIIVGTFLGAFLFEITFAMKNPMEGMRAGFGALVGTVLSLFFEFLVALVMAGLIIRQVWY